MKGKWLGLAALAGAGLLGYAWAGERPQMRLDRYEIALPGGAGAGLRILHLADQHFGPETWVQRRRLRHLQRLLPGLRPDLILFTGDFLHNDAGLAALEHLLRLLPPARLGVFAVLGNHDYAEYSWSQFFGGVWRGVGGASGWRRKLDAAAGGASQVARLGLRILRNERLRFARTPNDTRELRALLALYDVSLLENTAIPLPGHPNLWLAGVDDPIEGAPDLAQTWTAVPPSAQVLLLTHHPDLAYQTPPGLALALSGHTHGGQVVLPGLGAVHTQGTRLPRRHASGWFDDLPNGARMFVSRGMGESTPLRFRCPPQVAVIDLAPGGSEGVRASASCARSVAPDLAELVDRQVVDGGRGAADDLPVQAQRPGQGGGLAEAGV